MQGGGGWVRALGAAGKKEASFKNLEEVMMKTLTQVAAMAVVALVIGIVLCSGSAQAIEIEWPEPTWPDIFEPNWPTFGGPPNEPLTLYLEMDPGDWDDVISNSPEPDGCIAVEVERPAWFWMKGEDANKIVVAVRRKKAFAYPDESNPEKVALKIDINQYYCDPYTEDCNLDPNYDPNAATEWHGLKKLSLEANSDAVDQVTEGLCVNLHRMASEIEGYGWATWHANWVKLYVNGDYIGVYVNNEQYDKQYMNNRGIYVSHDSWLYKHHDCDGNFVLKVGDDDFPRSPAVDALCYDPFYSNVPQTQSSGGQCSVPDDANIIADVNQYVNVRRMLTTAAVDAFITNSDCLFNHNNNTYFLDWNLDDPCETRKRMYFAWDVDAVIKNIDWTMYYVGSSSSWEETILDIPYFRSQYNQIIRDLLDGPFTEENIHGFLDMVEPVITDAIEADTYGLADVSAKIDELKTWISNRITNVRNQVDWDEPLMPPGTVLLDDDFNNTTWDANWTISGAWEVDSSTYAHESPSAKAPAKNSGTFTCLDLDTSDAETVHVDFWLQKDDIDTAEDIILYYYNGTSYVNVYDLYDLGADDEWLHYTDTITDSNYFVSSFKIRLDAALENGENVWLDEVVITKELPPPAPTISGTILDPGAQPVVGVSVDADGGGGSDTTDPNGEYGLTVPYDWSGTVTPTKTDYTFAPTDRSYSNVTTDQSTQDYTATHVCDLYPDGIFDLKDVDVVCENWLTAGPDGDIDSSAFVDLADFTLLADMF